MALALLAIVPTARADDWQLVWSDEFDQPTIDATKWSSDVDCWGGGNNERQCYTESRNNAAIVDGKLVITALRQRASGSAFPQSQRTTAATRTAAAARDYTSARLTTRGKASWRYGRIEVRALVPQGQGAWPAIWMLPEEGAYGPWAASGEIDILEAVNLGVRCKTCLTGREDTILGTLHFGGKWPANLHRGTEVHAPEVLEGFHNYAIEWQRDRMIWQIDGHTYAERSSNEWSTTGSKSPGAPFDRKFHLIVNLAIGGGLAESRGTGGVATGGFPKRFAMDWIRVWQKRDRTDRSPTGQPSEEGK
ncbi:glycoside hydrolase family 16 protein [Sphingomonas sp. SUN039]|uniref:glycoside hydrolase family 16 protein n=1 Tax=Sphingomonas sp. SUN039 TaxID=2937787 RepID=UPI002164C77E|nr:glycoside hydrolase family 16 protein [Sphingomonas sp. SUN039]UVO53076.1 glycoside hydrolase family 16 protein [Sphingomonas sp. SUN039]